MKLKMWEVIALNEEIKGLVNENLSYLVKYKLNKLSVMTEQENSLYQIEFGNIMKEYGSKNESGQLVISKDNENYSTATEEINGLLSHEIDIKHEDFPISDFESIKSDSNYPVFSKLH